MFVLQSNGSSSVRTGKKRKRSDGSCLRKGNGRECRGLRDQQRCVAGSHKKSKTASENPVCFNPQAEFKTAASYSATFPCAFARACLLCSLAGVAAASRDLC